MDWSKAKSILIIIFAILNIFLLSIIITSMKQDNVIAGAITDTEKILSANNVKLECKIPDFNRDTGLPDFSEIHLDRKRIVKTLLGIDNVAEDEIKDGVPIVKDGNRITFSGDASFTFNAARPVDSSMQFNVKEAEKYIRNLFKSMDAPLSGLQLDESGSLNETGMFLAFIGTYGKSYKIFDSSLVVTFTNNGIKSMQYTLKTIAEINQLARIVPAYQILLAGFNEPGTVIKAADLGFKGYKPETDSAGYIYIPVWRIKTGNGSERYFKAYTGEELVTE